MPILINHLLSDFKPNTCNPYNPNSESSWFSCIKNRYSYYNSRSISPPTKMQFSKAWNEFCMNTDAQIVISGGNLEQCKQNLERYEFRSIYMQRPTQAEIDNPTIRKNKIKAAIWVRMIIAFNVYAAVRKELTIRPYHKIDFIGLSNHTPILRNVFHGRCALFIPSAVLTLFISNYLLDEAISENRDTTKEFWRFIFYVYDSMRPAGRVRSGRINDPARINRTRNNTVNISRVDNPTHSIAQEYLNRTDEEDEIDIIPNNQHIANMLMNTENQLPNELKKIIYETCTALQVSCSTD